MAKETKEESKYNFLQDMFREERGGKYSSKKIWGAVVMALLCASYSLDGLSFYKINENLFNTMAVIGTTLIGLKAISGMFSKK